MPETYWEKGKDWCRCHGRRPHDCPGPGVSTYVENGKDWCHCHGERPDYCQNRNSSGGNNSSSGGFYIPFGTYTWKF